MSVHAATSSVMLQWANLIQALQFKWITSLELRVLIKIYRHRASVRIEIESYVSGTETYKSVDLQIVPAAVGGTALVLANRCASGYRCERW